MNSKTILTYIGLLSLPGQYVSGQGLTTPPILTPTMPIPTPKIDFTDIPSYMVDDAMNHDVGRFVPMQEEFQYHNDQDRLMEQRPLNIGAMPCWYQYTRCIRNLVAHERKCGYNAVIYKGYMVHANYCDIFFENCRRGYRVWRIIAFGRCYTHNSWYGYKVHKVYRGEGK